MSVIGEVVADQGWSLRGVGLYSFGSINWHGLGQECIINDGREEV